MKVFLSWSGDRSKQVAAALHGWIPMLVHDAEVWLSDRDIGAGERWAQTLGKKLEECDFGIICLTPENQSEPWLLFEAGALSKSLDLARVCPYLFDLELRDLAGPLAQFQAKKAEKEPTRELMQAINVHAASPLSATKFDELFSLVWVQLADSLERVTAATLATTAPRAQGEVLEELVSVIRSLDHRVATLGRTRAVQVLSKRVPIAIVAVEDFGPVERERILHYFTSSALALLQMISKNTGADVSKFGVDWYLRDPVSGTVFDNLPSLDGALLSTPPPDNLELTTCPF